ncbi:HDOD domain-containing protein [Desulfurispirillum indicum]|uniref:Metal-dependent hydrolase HDOD n=1 Tax=Desulfurispirillum indicum (strain ATCC BAA-1389 / DSM 22839 / S5) TaxID=653733 RepID=E6W5G6_DESIS|nr:HDOD domain-containing protein [Desulfurispirillum indicum]ADU64897.1 Metal-dependent hydrolase HDOD [Desulfurispirillum indicum S5]UCZ56828.1 HDOD domain-containing protein [Desulfurispirillum indicum]
MSRIVQLLDSTESFPSPSGVIAEVVETLNDDNVNFEKIARSISMDPTLSGRILGMANSAYYARGKECSSVQNAIMRIGMDSLSGLVLGAFAAQLGERSNMAQQHLSQFWRHSLCVAILSKTIARDSRLPHSELAYVTGILHNIGSLAMQVLDDSSYGALELKVRAGSALKEAEEELYGVDHWNLGHHIAMRWKLPKPICAAIENHHRVDHMDSQDPYRGLSAIVAMGDILSRHVFAEEPIITLAPHSESYTVLVQEITGTTEEKIQEVLHKTSALQEEISSLVSELL